VLITRQDAQWVLLKRIILAWRESGDVIESGIAVRLSGLLDAPPNDQEKWLSKFHYSDVVELQKKVRNGRLGGATAPDVERASEIIEKWLRERPA
jgi:hypothetical protein